MRLLGVVLLSHGDYCPHATVSPQTGDDREGNLSAKEEEKQTASASLLSTLP